MNNKVTSLVYYLRIMDFDLNSTWYEIEKETIIIIFRMPFF